MTDDLTKRLNKMADRIEPFAPEDAALLREAATEREQHGPRKCMNLVGYQNAMREASYERKRAEAAEARVEQLERALTEVEHTLTTWEQAVGEIPGHPRRSLVVARAALAADKTAGEKAVEAYLDRLGVPPPPAAERLLVGFDAEAGAYTAKRSQPPAAELSQDRPQGTLPSDSNDGGHDEEPDEITERELLDGDAAERRESQVPGLRAEVRDEQADGRLVSLDGVPLVRVAHDSDRTLKVTLGDVVAAFFGPPAEPGEATDEARTGLKTDGPEASEVAARLIARADAYAGMLRDGVDEEEVAAIREAEALDREAAAALLALASSLPVPEGETE